MNAIEKLDLGRIGEDIPLDDLIILYKSTIDKLEECAHYRPSKNPDEDLENSNKENSQMLLQDKIMHAVLKRQIKKLSDVQKVLNFWKLCSLSQKMPNDYEDSDHLILKSLGFMEALNPNSFYQMV